MPSHQLLSWLTAILAAGATVSAMPVVEKRAVGDWVTATIDGQVVSWQNNWSGSPTSAPASAVPAQATGAGQWITATIDGQVVSWQMDATTAPAATTAVATSSPAATSAVPTSAAPAPASTATQGANCKDVHIFIARGWNEPYPGRQGALAGSICYGLDSCDYEDIQFYAGEDSVYCTAITEGATNGLAQMTAYAQNCPNSKLVLTGYSEGAQIVGDIMGGSDRPDCNEGFTGHLDPSTTPGNQLGAALLFGNPEHVANEPYNTLPGSAYSAEPARSGDSITRMDQFSNVLRDYCHEADPICAAAGPGPFDVNEHLNYFELYTDEAGGWVKAKLGY